MPSKGVEVVMAFYHVGSCSCPAGDCWCGPESTTGQLDALNRYVYFYSHQDEKEYDHIRGFFRKLYPHEIARYRKIKVKIVYLGEL